MKNNWRATLSVSSFLALRGISRDKRKVILTIFIISLGFISSIIIFGLLKDASAKLSEDYTDTYFGDIILEPFEQNAKIDHTQNIIDKLETLPDILGQASISKLSARMYDSRGKYIDKEIWVVNPDDFERAAVIASFVHEGDYLSKSDKGGFFTGCLNLESCSEFTAGFPYIDVDVGEPARFVFNTGESANLSLRGNYKHTFATVENIVLISEETAKNMLADYNSNHSDAIIIRLSNRDLADKVVRDISFLDINAKILTGKEKVEFYTKTVDSFNLIGNLSFLIGVVIAVISVYVLLYINALNKKTQIGIMRALGVNRKVITLSYTLQGFIYGVFGSILGIVLTFVMIAYFHSFPLITSIGRITPVAPTGIFFLLAITLIAASALTGYVVSNRIIKQKILESILNE